MQGQTGQAADQHAVEPDVLQVAADGELDAADQQVEIPDLTWSAIKRPTPLFWLSTKSASASTKPRLMSAQIGGSAGELAADVDQEGVEVAADLALGRLRIIFQEIAQALPDLLGDSGRARAGRADRA